MRKLIMVVALGLLASCSHADSNDSSSESSQHYSSQEMIESSEPTEVDVAEAILQEMTLEEKVGQMFLVRLPDEGMLELVESNSIGGYIWFAKDFSEKTPEQVQDDINRLQQMSEIPLFQAVDEEGGSVTRISQFPQFREQAFPAPSVAFTEGSWEDVEQIERDKALLLASLGFNLNLAPVADIPISQDDFIYERAFSTDPLEVSQYVETAVRISQEEKVGSVLKHFPGYGDNVDTHTGVAYDNRALDNFYDRDFLPFQAGIAQDVAAVLVSHNVVTAIDDRLPASLSPAVIDLLRNDLAFNGIIMTDDLVMEGVQQFLEPEETAVQAVLAGNDVLIRSEVTIQREAVLAAVAEGRLSEERINESVLRILKIKLQLELID